MTRPAAETWTDPDSQALTLLVLFLAHFGLEGLDWDPDTIALEVRDTWRVDLPESGLVRLSAAIEVLNSDGFQRDLPTFVRLAGELEGIRLAPGQFDPPDAAELAWALTQALLIESAVTGLSDEEEPFSDDVRRYIGQTCLAEGLVDPPDVLRLGILDVRPEQADPAVQAEKRREILDVLRAGVEQSGEQLQDLDLAAAEPAVEEVRRVAGQLKHPQTR